MTSLKAYLWPADIYRRLIHLLGLTVWLGTYAVGVYFFILEVPEVLREGIGFFLNDLFLRLVIGLAFCASALLPYFLGSIGAATTRASLPIFLVCIAAFVVDVWVRVDGIFFSGSSTGGLIAIFIPFYLAIPVSLIWGLCAVFSRRSRKAIAER